MTTDVTETAALPPATRYAERSVAPTARDVTGVRLTTRGEIRLGRGWWPFRAHEVTVPGHGYFRELRAAGVVRIVDAWVAGTARRETTVLGRRLHPAVVGPDLARAARAHATMSAIFVPSVLAPCDAVRWTEEDRDTATVAFAVAGSPVALRLTLHRGGLPRRVTTTRWGDPGHTGFFRDEPFGAEILEHRTFGGLTVPATGVLGWRVEGEGPAREVLRFQVTALEPLHGEGPAEIAGDALSPDAGEGENR
ncbi:hypothetical protein EV188_104551 [Actinomycetospora succinea]|uniref:Uncharacterized protein n=1 Tax=Actinomycetospora succinea TaxID=663603 RepID=A0A4R6VDJ3_9PSEU|nr:DUF6544 family protein [Actinomycetospora succinea]TDQ58804.1 hypothetical protein EV188_104551 [Actinomycetospora succinea]